MSAETPVLDRQDDDIFDLDIRISTVAGSFEITAGPTNYLTCCNVNTKSQSTCACVPGETKDIHCVTSPCFGC